MLVRRRQLLLRARRSLVQLVVEGGCVEVEGGGLWIGPRFLIEKAAFDFRKRASQVTSTSPHQDTSYLELSPFYLLPVLTREFCLRLVI